MPLPDEVLNQRPCFWLFCRKTYCSTLRKIVKSLFFSCWVIAKHCLIWKRFSCFDDALYSSTLWVLDSSFRFVFLHLSPNVFRHRLVLHRPTLDAVVFVLGCSVSTEVKQLQKLQKRACEDNNNSSFDARCSSLIEMLDQETVDELAATQPKTMVSTSLNELALRYLCDRFAVKS